MWKMFVIGAIKNDRENVRKNFHVNLCPDGSSGGNSQTISSNISPKIPRESIFSRSNLHGKLSSS